MRGRETLVHGALLVGLVLGGAGVRLAVREIPNFAPIAGLALFAGFFSRSLVWAAVVPLTAMALSDLFLDGYEPVLRVTVYGMLALPVLAGPRIRRWLVPSQGPPVGACAAVAGLAGCTLAASCAFFLVTNLVVWAQWYPRSRAGLAECYVRAIPFFRFTLAGDLLFAAILFGTWALASRLTSVPSRFACRASQTQSA